MRISKKIIGLTCAAILGTTVILAGWSGSVAHADTPHSHFKTYQIELTENEKLYLFNNSDSNSATTNQIAPQTVTMLNEIYGFKQIQTWLGLRWIAPNKYNELRDTMYKLLVQVPIMDIKGNAWIAPQNVHVLKKTYKYMNDPNSSYLIDTWLGPKWIMPGRFNIIPIVEAVPEQIKIHLVQETPTVNYPEDKPSGAYTVINPQVVESFERWNNWYHVHTDQGDQWLIPSHWEGFFGDIEPVNMKVSVPTATQLYSQPLYSQAVSFAKLASQTVAVKGKYDHWYQITTWMGDMWIDGDEINIHINN